MHLRMTDRRLNGIVDAATGAADADHVLVHAGLRDQVLIGDIDIAGPLRAAARRSQAASPCFRHSAALAEAAIDRR